MMAGWLSFSAALTGFGLLSLTMQRHAHAWAGRGAMWRGPVGKSMLRLAGAGCLIGSCAAAFRGNAQFGAICWAAYLLGAALIVTGLHAYAERWAVSAIVLLGVALLGSMIL